MHLRLYINLERSQIHAVLILMQHLCTYVHVKLNQNFNFSNRISISRRVPPFYMENIFLSSNLQLKIIYQMKHLLESFVHEVHMSMANFSCVRHVHNRQLLY